jgi:hypothetical protein
VFSGLAPEYANMTLLEALGNGGGGIVALLRQAVAALLSAAQPFIAYPYATIQVIALTNAAIASGSATLIEAQKNEFDKFNNYEADIDQSGKPAVPPVNPTPPAAPGTIPSLSISDSTVTEGKSGSTTVVTLTITLSSPSTTAISVTVGVTGGTAASGTDYTSVAPRTITFAPGQTTATYMITIIGDKTSESSETILVGLSNATGGATIGDGSGSVTILDDD